MACSARSGVRLSPAESTFRRARIKLRALCLLVASFCTAAHAALQFDVFLGYDGVIPEATWFPVVCEIKNDGPSFNGVIELTGGSLNQGQVQKVEVELPTGTLKRLVIPVFSATRGFNTSWDVRLLDERGQVRALMAWLNAGGHLIVAIEQINDVTASPWLKNLLPCEVKNIQPVQRHVEIQQWLQSATWSTNLGASGANNQQFGRRYGMDRNRSAPAPPSYQQNRATQETGTSADKPFGNLPDDFGFEAVELQVATSTLRDGRIVVAAEDVPLIVTAPRGLGRVTALLFSPEREPFRSWKNLPTFWAKLTEVPGDWYSFPDFNQPMRPSSDGIFGAMIETRQVHKLPIEWLLVLLILYLVVIGPLDQFW